MKKLFLLLMAVGCFGAASAQRVYFVYLQTEDGLPFYVRMTDKIYSSAASGYLILPNLVDSTYIVHLGFAKNTSPETRFALTVNQNDKGYLIKNFTEGLALFDMQDLSIVKPATGNQSTNYETRSDRFSSVLSKAADDPSLLKVAKKEEKTPEIVAAAEQPKPVAAVREDSSKKRPETTKAEPETALPKAVQDTVTAIATSPTNDLAPSANQPETIASSIEQPYKRSTVRRYSESSTTEGLGVVYFDQFDGAVDTIRILIPPSKSKLEDAPVVIVEPVKQEQIAVVEPTSTKLEKPIETRSDAASNSACPSVASEKDFMKLRKNIAGKETDEEMIAEARKAFKNKCFSTEQVRYLGAMFLTSAARYQFFDAAYNHVTDKQAFGSLQSEIKDEYYLKRFKALIGE